MKIEFNIIIIMAVLISATLFLIYQSPNETPKSMSFKKHGTEITQINEDSKKYQMTDDEEKIKESKKLVKEKIKEVSADFLGVKISKVTLLEGQYPFLDVKERAGKLDLEPSQICPFEQNIPLHLQKISHTSNFAIFAKKYSPYPIELIIMDERSDISNIHYGLIAINIKNQSASTYFHLDSCTNEITDNNPYLLHCFDGNDDYSFATFNTDDIVSSYSNGHFCKIVLDPWRQSVLEYSWILRDKQRQLEQEWMTGNADEESRWKFFSQIDRLGELRNLVGRITHHDYDEQTLHEQIEQYEKQYGVIPEELSKLMEERK